MNEEIIDLSETIEANSNQLNAIDLVASPRTITITGVKKGAADQPVSISFEGDNGKPWMPCLGMRRVLAKVWGLDGRKYIGQKVTLFNNPTVRWAGKEIGGIQVSHATGITKEISIPLTLSRGQFSTIKVKPIIAKPKNALSDEQFVSINQMIVDAQNMAELSVVAKTISEGYYDDEGKAKLLEVYQARSTAIRGEAS
tara:strand:- start:637 stop:1230 length:594 start_codon:yes stop_codon:yes gene_type:complete